jgi:hypothetical protein
MGIDRIGKGPPPTADIGQGERAEKATKTDAVDKPFSVERADRTKATAAVDATNATSPLAQLKSGAIDMDRYLDLRVDEATKSLGAMPASQLDDIKKMLRDQIASDPTLIDLVKTATGKVPNPPENE